MNDTIERTAIDRVYRLVKAATGENYGDGITVTDICNGYAEPGYGGSDTIVVFGDWNDKDNRRWIKPENGGNMVREGAAPSLKDRMPSRLFDALESIPGVECQWLDEWTSCSDCYRAMRTQSDSYHWKLYGSFSEDGYVCADCMKENSEYYLEEYDRNPDTAVSWLTSADMVRLGYTEISEGQNGWHEGMDDNPKAMLATASKFYDADAKFIFLLDEASQFYISFSLWVKESDEND